MSFQKFGFTKRQIEILQMLDLDLSMFGDKTKSEITILINDRYTNLLQSQKASANTFPSIESANSSAIIEHEASAGKISESILYYLQSRGLSAEQSTSLIIAGICDPILSNLPFEFVMEAKELLKLKIEGF